MSLQSGSWQSPTSSRGVPSLLRPRPRSIRNCSLSPEAEAPFDPELSHLSRGRSPVRSETASRGRSSSMRSCAEPRFRSGWRSTRGLLSGDLVKAGLPREVVPPTEAVGRAIRVTSSRWRPPVTRSDHRKGEPAALPSGLSPFEQDGMYGHPRPTASQMPCSFSRAFRSFRGRQESEIRTLAALAFRSQRPETPRVRSAVFRFLKAKRSDI